MPSDLYPMWGESSSAITPQMYNWAQLDYANQNANIGRRQAYDQQDIANQQNYFQMRRAIEAEDAQREQAARQEAARLALAEGESSRRNYQFGQSVALEKERLRQQEEANKMRYAPDFAAEAAAKKQEIINAIAAGKISPLDASLIASVHGIPQAQAVAIASPFVEAFKSAKLDAANVALDKSLSRLKPGQEPNWDNLDKIRDTLPANMRNDVYLDKSTQRFLASKPPVAGMGNLRASEAYDFSPPRGASPVASASLSVPPVITPQTAPANVIAPIGNQGGGYFPQPQAKPLTPEIAREYRRRYGSREAAERAARADGYTWTP